MADPFLGEIRMVGFNFAPQGWATCDGQILQASQNQALYALLGNTYGGTPGVNFALPDFRGRVPVHFGPDFALGHSAGEAGHMLSVDELPGHTHVASASDAAADLPLPANNAWAAMDKGYASTPDAGAYMAGTALGASGGSQPHPNMQPYLVLNFVIALVGIFPSRD